MLTDEVISGFDVFFRAEVFLELRLFRLGPVPRPRSRAAAGPGRPRVLSLHWAAAGGRAWRPRGGRRGAGPWPGAASGQTGNITLFHGSAQLLKRIDTWIE